MKTISLEPISYEDIQFIETKEYRRFTEFVQACSQYRYIGVCHGEPGVGKSLAATYYAQWDEEIWHENLRYEISAVMINKVKACKSVLWVAPVSNTPKIVDHQIRMRVQGYGRAFYKANGENELNLLAFEAYKACPLVIIDEADRLSYNSLEQVRHWYDQWKFGLVLIGMPGIERRLSRYPQLYSRIGFSHEFCKLSKDEMRFIFERKWKEFGATFNPDYFPDVEAVNAIMRITAGNFRLIERLFSQIRRILSINKLDRITKEVVDTARDCLVIGHIA